MINQQPKSSRKSKRGSKGRKGFHPYLVARINPFTAGVSGIRAPDEFGYPTGTALLRAATQMTADAAGYTARGFTPFSALYRKDAFSITAGTVVWNAGSTVATPQDTALATLSTLYRTVAWGVRITTDSSLTNAQGHIWVACIPLDLSASSPSADWPTTEAMMTATVLSEKYSVLELAQKPLIVPGRMFDDGIYRFRSSTINPATATNLAVESSNGWCAIVVYLSGGIASTTAINVEYINHVEYLQDASSLYGFVDTVPGLYEPEVMVQASRLESVQPVAIVEQAVQSLESAAGYASRLGNAASKMIPLISGGMRVANVLGKMRGSLKSAPSFPMLQWDDEKW